MTSKDIFVDFRVEWPKLYNKIKDTKWFHNIASYYSSMMIDTVIKGDYKTYPIIRIMNMENNTPSSKDVLFNATSPSKPEWWITPGDCFCVNGIFIFLIMIYSGHKVKIYANSKHIFLRNEQNKILDLYYPQYSNCDDYKDAKEILPLDLWHSYDVLSDMTINKKTRFIFKDKLISLKFTHSTGNTLTSITEEE